MAGSNSGRETWTSIGDLTGGVNQINIGGTNTQNTITAAQDPLSALLGKLNALQTDLDAPGVDCTTAEATGQAIADLSAHVKEPRPDRDRVGKALRKAQGLAVQALSLTQTVAGLDQAVSALFQ